MSRIESQTTGAPVKRRWVRGRWRALLISVPLLLAALGVASWVVYELQSRGAFLPWLFEYDRAAYARVRRAIEADPRHEGGRPFEEVSRELGLDDVPWDDVAIQQEACMARIYHFPGFALHATLESLPDGITPATRGARPAPPDAPERLWLPQGSFFVHVDGLDREERMRRYRKSLQDMCDLINAEMKQRRQTNGSP